MNDDELRAWYRDFAPRLDGWCVRDRGGFSRPLTNLEMYLLHQAGDLPAEPESEETMKVSEEFGGAYLKATDLQGRTVNVTIASISQESLRDTQTREESDKWVLWFVGKTRGLVLNKTNAETLAHLLGDDSDGWIGKRIQLFTTRVEMGGKLTEGIRVQSASAAAPPVPAVPDLPPDDEIPF